MSHLGKDKSRISQRAYWSALAAAVTFTGVAIGGGIAFTARDQFSLASLLFLLVVPVQIWLRVMMVRRCRAIGWPAALPWAGLAAVIAANTAALALETGGPGAGLPLLALLADGALMVLIGSPADGGALRKVIAQTSSQPGGPTAGVPAEPTGRRDPVSREAKEAEWDAAIARALSDRQGGAADRTGPGAPAARPGPGLNRPGGFGRRSA